MFAGNRLIAADLATMVDVRWSLIALSLSLLNLSVNGDDRNQSLSEERIINGVQVNIRNYKHYVFLQDNKGFCGGALVHLNKIVTAAHCCVGFNSPLNAYPGVNNLNELSNTRRYVSYQWYSHGGYRNNRIYDLCVVILTENVRLNDRIGLIPLARYPPPINSYITLVGHGSTDCSRLVNGACVKSASNPLMMTKMVVNGYQGPMIVVRMTPNRPCKGDSGGPWTYQGKLVAVESHSQGSWCTGNYNFEASTMLSPMPQFLAQFGIYPQ